MSQLFSIGRVTAGLELKTSKHKLRFHLNIKATRAKCRKGGAFTIREMNRSGLQPQNASAPLIVFFLWFSQENPFRLPLAPGEISPPSSPHFLRQAQGAIAFQSGFFPVCCSGPAILPEYRCQKGLPPQMAHGPAGSSDCQMYHPPVSPVILK